MEQLLDVYIHNMVNIDEMQFNFVPGRDAIEGIVIAFQLHEKYITDNKQLYFASIDRQTAFDCVPQKVCCGLFY